MRKDCALSRLSEDQQADLFDWLTTDTYDVVLKRIAQPPPDGFGIKTHINSLYRFYAQRQAAIRAHDFAALAAQERIGSDSVLSVNSVVKDFEQTQHSARRSPRPAPRALPRSFHVSTLFPRYLSGGSPTSHVQRQRRLRG